VRESAQRPVLSGRSLFLSFGGVNALSGVSFDVSPGEIFAVIGPNGAGKSSLLNCISGLYHPQRGAIELDGTDVTSMPPHGRARLGLARTFQNLALFREMSVLDNVLTGRHLHGRTGTLGGGLLLPGARSEERRHREAAAETASFLGLGELLGETVGTLAYGVQKRVEMARALAAEPKLLLLDEPMAGMNSGERDDMVRAILDANAGRGVTVVMIEHDMGLVMDLSDTVCVLDFGRRIALGTPAQVKDDPHVIRAYLGEEDD
jgi:branched-chain amino acid transport system ATP-binding protein